MFKIEKNIPISPIVGIGKKSNMDYVMLFKLFTKMSHMDSFLVPCKTEQDFKTKRNTLTIFCKRKDFKITTRRLDLNKWDFRVWKVEKEKKEDEDNQNTSRDHSDFPPTSESR